MNISELSDTELNRAMIWLYPPRFKLLVRDEKYFIDDFYGDCEFSYLFAGDLVLAKIYSHENVSISAGNQISVKIGAINYTSANKSFIRSACEVLVQIGMDGKK